MKAILKSIWVDSATTNFDEYWLTDSEFFYLWIEFNGGLENVVGSDDFRIFVSAPARLGENCSHAGVRGERLFWLWTHMVLNWLRPSFRRLSKAAKENTRIKLLHRLRVLLIGSLTDTKSKADRLKRDCRINHYDWLSESQIKTFICRENDVSCLKPSRTVNVICEKLSLYIPAWSPGSAIRLYKNSVVSISYEIGFYVINQDCYAITKVHLNNGA